MYKPLDFKKFVDSIFNRQNLKKPPLVEVLWFDASDIAADWFDNDDIIKSQPAPSLAVGYLVSKDETSVKVVSLLNDTHAGHGIMIPMGMVKKINYLHR